jgi:hypothetical protein
MRDTMTALHAVKPNEVQGNETYSISRVIVVDRWPKTLPETSRDSADAPSHSADARRPTYLNMPFVSPAPQTFAVFPHDD